MNGIMRSTLVALLGASLLGGELAAGANLAIGAKQWIAGGQALALRRAGAIAAGTLAEVASNQARTLAFEATMSAVRGVGALYGALQGPPRCSAATCTLSVTTDTRAVYTTVVVHPILHAHPARSRTS